MGKISSFFDLNTWKEAHKLVLMVYKIVNNFPNKEKYILSNQILRCSISITSNIAEGFSRRGKKEKVQFYTISLGSLTELQNQLKLSHDLDYVDIDTYDEIFSQTVVVQKLLHGLIKGVKSHNS